MRCARLWKALPAQGRAPQLGTLPMLGGAALAAQHLHLHADTPRKQACKRTTYNRRQATRMRATRHLQGAVAAPAATVALCRSQWRPPAISATTAACKAGLSQRRLSRLLSSPPAAPSNRGTCLWGAWGPLRCLRGRLRWTAATSTGEYVRACCVCVCAAACMHARVCVCVRVRMCLCVRARV